MPHQSLEQRRPPQAIQDTISEQYPDCAPPDCTLIDEQYTYLGKQASGREYWRISPKNDSRRCVLMRIPEDLSGEIVNGKIQDKSTTESSSPTIIPMQENFCKIAELFLQHKIPVPQIFASHSKPSFLIIDDLGSDTLESVVTRSNTAQVTAIYQTAIRLLVTLQTKLFPPAAEHRDLICYHRHFGPELLQAELDHFTEWLAYAGLDHHFSSADVNKLSNLFSNIVESISELPKTLIHRDYQSRNIMRRSAQRSMSNKAPSHEDLLVMELVLIDFQDAMIGPCIYDLVALLQDSYIDLSAEQITTLMQQFFAQTTHFATYRDFEVAFWTQVVQRKLKDSGRFVYLERKRGDASFLAHIPRSIACVKHALNRLTELDSLWASALLSLLTPVFDAATEKYSSKCL